MEEIFFRGFLLRVLDDWIGSWGALIVVSVLFALVHALSSPAGPIAALFVLISASLALNMAWFLSVACGCRSPSISASTRRRVRCSVCTSRQRHRTGPVHR